MGYSNIEMKKIYNNLILQGMMTFLILVMNVSQCLMSVKPTLSIFIKIH